MLVKFSNLSCKYNYLNFYIWFNYGNVLVENWIYCPVFKVSYYNFRRI